MFSFSLFFMCKHEKKEDEEGREQQLSLSYIFWPSCDEGVKKEVIDLKTLSWSSVLPKVASKVKPASLWLWED